MDELSRSDVFLKLSLGSTEVAVYDMEILTVQTGVDGCSQYQITLSMAHDGLLTRARP
jgi:hypothetical protein